MARYSALSLGLLILAVAPVAHAAETASYRQTDTRAYDSSYGSSNGSSSSSEDKLVKPKDEGARSGRDWMLSLEGVAVAPTDVGAQVGLEMPFGLRLFAGYGFMPGASLGWLRGWSVAYGDARATVNAADASGRILRLKAGFRPFPRLGLYIDGGYARAMLDATVDVTGSVQGGGSVSGGYHAVSDVDLWLVELGYQWKIERRLIVGLGLGFMGTVNASTTITPTGSSAAVDANMLGTAQRYVNGALEGYGFVPTLNLRVGFNVL